MKIYDNPAPEEWDGLCRRAEQNNEAIRASVLEIVSRVEAEGDAALFDYARRFDGVELKKLRVSEAELEEAETALSRELKEAIAAAARNIRAFHQAQHPSPVRVQTQAGVLCEQRPVAIDRVGLYIPGGTAPLFSTVLMLAIPAKLAGCGSVVLCTPCNKEGKVAPEVLYTASFCGVTQIFKSGGAQAIAAMACGTESIPKVDKIFGPGNRFVTMAKQIVSTKNTAIDMPAGPSEVMVMADATAKPAFVAADLLSQAEHGRDSQALLVCQSRSIAEAVNAEVEKQAALLQRGEYVRDSLANSRAIVLPERESMLAFANRYAAEHLIISMKDPWQLAENVRNAGSVFIGNYSPESAGDYASGTNHTLPTSAWARAYSGVNIDSFLRKITFQEISREGIAALAPVIRRMAYAEGLEAHARAVELRVES